MDTTKTKGAPLRGTPSKTPRAHPNTKTHAAKVRRALSLLVDASVNAEASLKENLDAFDSAIRILKKNSDKAQKLLLAWRGRK